jgi:hypothetical protein
MNQIALLIRCGDAPGLRAALDRDPALARAPRATLEAARLARRKLLAGAEPARP